MIEKGETPSPVSHPEGDEVFLDEHREASHRAVLGVEEQLREGGDLGRAIPAVGAVHEDAAPLPMHGPGDVPRSREELPHGPGSETWGFTITSSL